MQRSLAGWVVARGVTIFARFVTGVRGNWVGCPPDPRPRVYFGNHTSHGDFVLIWTVLPGNVRKVTRPVAAADYWQKGTMRRFLGRQVFDAVLIDRTGATPNANPISLMLAALDEGNSLIFFPEGTRNTTGDQLLAFRSGIFNLATARPDVELIPVWIENLNRVMPKGEFIPIPLLCTVTFGTPIRLAEDEERTDFVARARGALLALAPVKDAAP
jgi:1-acyl-sn-glycerol-3-phosphate acyltransferase